MNAIEQAIEALNEALSDGGYLPNETCRNMLNAIKGLQSMQGEAVGWQFYQDSEWHNGDNKIKDHKANTVAAGYPVRELYTHPQSPAVPEGYVLVPVEPTASMLFYASTINRPHDLCREIYRDMISGHTHPKALLSAQENNN